MEMWNQYVDLLKPAADLIARTRAPDDKQVQATLCRHLMMNLSLGYLAYFQADADYPDWIPWLNSAYRMCAPNPDGVYYYTHVDGKGVYRVTGERGNALMANFAIGKKIIGKAYPPGQSFNNYNFDDLTLNDDTSFEVIFSTERPAGYTGDWLYLHPEADHIVVRQFSYDWGRDHDVRLAIERLDVPPLKPPMSLEETDRNLRELMGGFADRMLRVCQDIEKKRAAGDVNKPYMEDYKESLGCHGESERKENYWPQVYWEVLYDIAEDEALILEIELPEKRHYWNIQINDAFYYQVESIHRQTSLNGHQAVLDADGKFRAVLSHQDPGIANWLDTVGNTYGILFGRWHNCSSHPMPTITKLKLKDLRQHLPATTPVFTAEQRAEQLHRRRIGAQLRRRW